MGPRRPCARGTVFDTSSRLTVCAGVQGAAVESIHSRARSCGKGSCLRPPGQGVQSLTSEQGLTVSACVQGPAVETCIAEQAPVVKGID